MALYNHKEMSTRTNTSEPEETLDDDVLRRPLAETVGPCGLACFLPCLVIEICVTPFLCRYFS
jgi:hypothetical protein